MFPLPLEVRMAWESDGSRGEEEKPGPREIFLARKERGRGRSWVRNRRGIPGRGWPRGVRSLRIPVAEDRGEMDE